jgi:L-iditol 2-dehydrogenase
VSRRMRAANLYAPGDLRVEQVPIPEPGRNEVLLKVKACGVCGSDISRIMDIGTYRYPTIPGHEFSGEVVAWGLGVEKAKMPEKLTVVPLIPCQSCSYCKIGDHHLCEQYSYLGSRRDGAFAEFVIVPAMNVVPLPENVDFDLGAMTDPAAVALHAVRHLNIRPGDRVAAFGVGAIGAFALQWAKIVGAGETIGVDVVPERLGVASLLGADFCINGDVEDPVEVIRDHTQGRGIERTLELAGNPVTQEQSVLVTAKRGSCVWAGISHRSLTISEKAVDDILRKEMTVKGSWNSSYTPLVNDWETALSFMGKGRLRSDNIISHRLPLEKVPQSLKMMQDRKVYFNKVMFFPEMP